MSLIIQAAPKSKPAPKPELPKSNNEIEVDVPDGESGSWKIDTVVVTREEAAIENMHMARYGRYVPPGVYKRLKRDGNTIMSNTPDEIQDHRTMFYQAKDSGGSVLINGLGLGVALKKVLSFENVTDVTVVELSEDVISLVSPYYKDERLTIVHASAYDYKPPKGKRYNVVWHDIWDNICSDNLPEMHKLHRKYGRRSDWQGSWCRGECEYQRDQTNRSYWG